MSNTKAHVGFLGDSGLQLHSTGPLYPWTIRGVGDTCQAFNCLDGRTGPRRPYEPNIAGSHQIAYDLAVGDAETQKLYDELKAPAAAA